MKPMNLQVTNKFYKKIRQFFFPDMQHDGTIQSVAGNQSGSSVTGKGSGLLTETSLSWQKLIKRSIRSTLLDDTFSDTQSTNSTRSKFIKRIRKVQSAGPSLSLDGQPMSWSVDAERTEESKIMAERAKANHSFVYIKIPQERFSFFLIRWPIRGPIETVLIPILTSSKIEEIFIRCH